MKQSSKVEKLITWRFTGPGVHVTGQGQILRKGDRLQAFPSEIEPFKDRFTPLEHLPEQGEEGEKDLAPRGTMVPKHVGGGRYSVIIEETGDTVTDGYITKAEAYAMCGLEDPAKRKAPAEPDPDEEGEEE